MATALMADLHDRLERHLASWLGDWPPKDAVSVATGPARTQPGWDGRVCEVLGVASPDGAVISVPPAAVEATRDLIARGGLEALRTGLGPIVGHAGATLQDAVFRWSEAPSELPDAGIWLPWDDARIPLWLRPFGGQVLVTLDDDGYVAGVGIKRHDRWGHELAVVTNEDHRGGGLARRLVAQAARKVIADGAVPTYLHDHRNVASAHVADAAGFPDLGWRVLALWDT